MRLGTAGSVVAYNNSHNCGRATFGLLMLGDTLTILVEITQPFVSISSCFLTILIESRWTIFADVHFHRI